MVLIQRIYCFYLCDFHYFLYLITFKFHLFNTNDHGRPLRNEKRTFPLSKLTFFKDIFLICCVNCIFYDFAPENQSANVQPTESIILKHCVVFLLCFFKMNWRCYVFKSNSLFCWVLSYCEYRYAVCYVFAEFKVRNLKQYIFC